jgi:hypothetical protein
MKKAIKGIQAGGPGSGRRPGYGNSAHSELKSWGFKHHFGNDGSSNYTHKDSGYTAKISPSGKLKMTDDSGKSYKGRVDQFVSDALYQRR